MIDCRDLCTCADKSKCDMVCRFNPRLFVARMREVRGLDFDTAPRTSANGVPTMPIVVPFVDHRYSRAAVLDESVIALSLYELVNLATGKLHVTSRAELAARFLIPEAAQVIVSGVAKDRPIERWWSLEDRESLLAALNELGIAVATTPNYSVLNDVPRTDNLHAMKRILLAWTEMASAGLATALHVNGRTEHDYLRWGDLIAKRPEIEILAFEFASGCGRGERIDWHVAQLCGLADRAGRPLAVVIRGGGRKLEELWQHFAQVTLVETDAFARTIRRRRAYLTDAGRLKWAKSATPKGAPIDDLLAHNVRLVRASYEKRLYAAIGSRPLPRWPGRATHRDGETVQPRRVNGLNFAGEARGVTPEPQGVVATAKS
ncbi:MAG: DUF4417 domain-containing protein [Gammaproteobacteria bacterium]|nr:DUF4417 domain-containing protein [Gammaproteobacteria bacterium]